MMKNGVALTLPIVNCDLGHYFSSDIEELTRKSGNFKSYDVFLSMLYSVLLKVIILYGRF